MLLIGSFFTFAGARFIFQIFAFIVFVFCALSIYLQIYNLFVATATFTILQQVALALFAVICGGMLSFGFYNFSYEWSIPLICFWCGVICALQLSDWIYLVSPTLILLFSVFMAFTFSIMAKRY